MMLLSLREMCFSRVDARPPKVEYPQHSAASVALDMRIRRFLAVKVSVKI